MKKFNKLKESLGNLESQKMCITTLEGVSILQFIKYKIIISKELKIKKQIEDLQASINSINLSYDTKIKKWIDDPKISCIKYNRIQQKEEYRKDLKLYKLGYIDKKPIAPLLKKFLPYIPKFNAFKFNSILPLHKKHTSTDSKRPSQTIEKLAIDATKICIKGYRKFCSNYKLIQNFVSSRNSIKYMKKILEEAKTQIDASESHNSIQFKNLTKKGIQFRESLKFTPKQTAISPRIAYNNKKKISYPSCKSRVVITVPTEYTL